MMKSLPSISTLLKFFPVFALAFYFSCATPPEYPNEPIIEFVSVSKDTIRRLSANNSNLYQQAIFVDTTIITIDFTDGDGDIGDRQDDTGFTERRIFYRDSRDSSLTQLQIPFVNEVGASSGVKGTISFNFIPTCCTSYIDVLTNNDPCNGTNPDFLYDEFTLEVYIEDRAGNVSNVITTTPIYIECFN